jgi:cytochrome c553
MLPRQIAALGCSLLILHKSYVVSVAMACAVMAGLHLRAQKSAAPDTLPAWAYSIPLPRVRVPGDPPPPPRDEVTLQHVPGSTVGYTSKFIGGLSTVADWFPDTHPPMPEVVESGHKPGGSACAHCHLPNGFGGPENANLAGQSEAYMLQQVEDFKSGARHSSAPNMGSVSNMIQASKTITPEELKAAVAYFASIKPQKWVRVVEAETVPTTHVGNYILVPDVPAATEPIGERVIEVPVDAKLSEMKDSKSSFIAYVPVGSLKRGEELVKTGGGKTMPCATCHGADLHGVGAIPAIAGRTPSGMTRQIMDIQSGARNGAAAAMMKPVVEKLTIADMVAITGYLASLNP